MKYNKRLAHIVCGCGAIIQVLSERADETIGKEEPWEDEDWDEAATAEAYENHLKSCKIEN